MAGEGDTKATEGTEEVQDPYRAADSRPEGLSAQEAARRLEQYGRNTLRQEEVGLLRRLAGYFWGPIPWMI
ncbi:MAG TPA: cation-transporting P-type ATPase, partial [Gammaproteobacteria bacterium]|nr:cation-transporting P-type ATPase [Gammaproteobacteria bacterium]